MNCSDKGLFVQCKAGDMIIWDSRSIHCNCPSQLPLPKKSGKDNESDEKENNNNDTIDWDLIRMTCYVCMVPKYKAPNDVLQERQLAFKQHVTATHWYLSFLYFCTNTNKLISFFLF